ncbi:MAG TPA: hypothetical protein VKQ52_13530 [Puia sp.]|nr:hypothetical protein [Puia sp.]
MQQQSATYLPVNWTDGMKINKDHFRAEQQAYNWQQAQHSGALLNGHNYGLFHSRQSRGSDRQIVLTTDNQQQVTIRLLTCHAITPGGHLVCFNEGSTAREDHFMAGIPGLQVPYAQLIAADTEYYVTLAVNPYDRVPVGQPNMTETQMRPPFTAPAYSLQLIDHRDMPVGGPGSFYLPLGRVRVSEGKVLPDETYIPPCTTVAAHSALTDAHAGLEHFFSSMELYTLRIQQKIVQKRQQNNLASVIMEICDKMNVYMSGEYQRVLLEYQQRPPVCLLTSVAGLARLMKNSIDIYTGAIKDELLNYFAEWCSITQGEWESASTAICNFRYDHLNIREALQQVEGFTQLTLRLFMSLASLEYIGKKREAGIFVKEHLVVPGEEMQVARRKSFLAD